MTINDMKHLLKSYNGIQTDIATLNIEIAHITGWKYAHIAAPTSNMNGMPHSGRISDPTYDEVQKLVATYDGDVRDLLMEIVSLEFAKSEIDTMMRWLRTNDQTGYDIVRLRYFMLNSWQQVGRKLKYAVSTVKNRHAEILTGLVNYWNK